MVDGILRGFGVKRKNRNKEYKTGITATMCKMSEMIWEFAGDFIRLDKSLERKQNRLNAACSAWNIACNSPEVRGRLLEQYVESYRSYNPNVSDENISGVRNNMELLIQNKLRLFPSIHKHIVGAQLTELDGKDRIEVASAEFE